MPPGRSLFNALLDILLPPVCHVCHTYFPAPDTLHVCPSCLDRLPVITGSWCSCCGIPFAGAGGPHRCSTCQLHPPAYERAWAPFLYDNDVRALIHRFKYEHSVRLRTPLAQLTARYALRYLEEQHADVLVPVPLHRSRLRQRGFNQAVLLGRQLSRALSIPLETDWLIRTRPTTPQIELTAEQRKSNVKGAFAVTPHARLAGTRVLLLDDVITTGSTINECARELKKGGVSAVSVLAIARAPAHHI